MTIPRGCSALYFEFINCCSIFPTLFLIVLPRWFVQNETIHDDCILICSRIPWIDWIMAKVPFLAISINVLIIIRHLQRKKDIRSCISRSNIEAFCYHVVRCCKCI
ncbi:hypothetical protein CW304_29950 [Bacillus sp. UFRGS-B20]|nr:hypothetical protein CW304_29950 [Bacillus sp. UFRGS-B20]